MPKPKNETSIPLHCSLCPKNPQFSDVSHLLTHISSKGHLSHRFKLQIRSQSEISARQLLDDFDIWYASNNLDAMLSDRLAAKDQKKASKERKSRVSAGTAKKETQKKEEFPLEPSLASTPVFRAPMPRMHLWPTMSHPNTQSSASLSEWEPSPVYATPTTRRAVPNFTSQETPDCTQLDPMLNTPWKPDNHCEERSDNKLTESMKLKGVHWPGMDLFDSATPEMKRMRNQRKDSSVLRQMMATSAEITTDEIVYNSNGTIHHIRDIFGPLSCENSPEKVNPTPRKRRPRKAAGALANLDANAPHIRHTRQRARKVIPESPVKRYTATQPQNYRGYYNGYGPQGYNPPPMLNPLVGLGRRITSDEDDEFKLTAEVGAKKRGFRIFHDGTADHRAGPEVSPVRTESSLEEPRFDFGIPALAPFSGSPGNLALASPTPMAKSNSVRIYGKENGQPDLPSQVQPQRPMAAGYMYQPQVFYDPMFNNMLYNPYNHTSHYSRSFPVGQNPSHQSLKAPQDYASSFQGSFKPVDDVSRSPVKTESSVRSPICAGSSSRSGSSSGIAKDNGMAQAL